MVALLSEVPGSRPAKGLGTWAVRTLGFPFLVTSPRARFAADNELNALVVPAETVRDPTYDASIVTIPGNTRWTPNEKLCTYPRCPAGSANDGPWPSSVAIPRELPDGCTTPFGNGFDTTLAEVRPPSVVATYGVV